MVTCICVAESLLWLPEVSTAVLIGYTPIRNKKLKKVHHNQIPETYRKILISSLIDMQYLLVNTMQYVFGKKDSSICGNFIDDHRARKKWEHFFPKLDENNCQLQILYLINYPFELKGERKNFPDKAKLREFASSTILKNFSKGSKIEKELRFWNGGFLKNK